MFKFDICSPLANISSTFFFLFFDLPLKLRVVYLRNKQTNSVPNMFNIVSVAMLLNQQERPPIKYCYPSSEIHWFISLKLGHWNLNARKYVRCARTFYLICNDCGLQEYMKDVNSPLNSKGWRPLIYTIFIHLWTVMVSDHRCSTWPSLN